MDNLAQQFERASRFFGERVTSIREDQWRLPTPCTEWDVRTLVNHLVNESLWVEPLFEGRTVAEVGDRFDGDLLGEHPKAVWERADAAARRAVGADGALSKDVHLSRGPTPATRYVWEMVMDRLIHGWDLARATGADEAMPPDLVERLYGELAPIEDGLKASGLFGPKVEPPPGADTQTKLLAVLGRVA